MSVVTADAVLAELEARAGAPDTDRAQWLLERARGVTATEVRDLWLHRYGKGGKSPLALIAEKRALLLAQTPEQLQAVADSQFVGNKYTAWGKKREPIIAGYVRSAFRIRPESRVFRSLSNARHLASPDGIAVDPFGRIEVAEIKTSKDDIAPGTPAYVKKGYELQQQWVMGVLGADRSLYAWEQHDNDWQDLGGQFFEPEPLDLYPSTQWIEFDEGVFDALRVIADAFLAQLDAAMADTGAPVIDEELDTLAVNYLRGLDLEKEAKALKEPAYRAMFERLDAGEPVVQESPLARVSFTPEIAEEKPVFELDQMRAKAAAPAGLYERLEQAEDDVRQAQEALARERMAVDAHEAEFVVQAGTERVVVKKAALRVTAARETKEQKA